jgi:hypothetical protein
VNRAGANHDPTAMAESRIPNNTENQKPKGKNQNGNLKCKDFLPLLCHFALLFLICAFCTDLFRD